MHCKQPTHHANSQPIIETVGASDRLRIRYSLWVANRIISQIMKTPGTEVVD